MTAKKQQNREEFSRGVGDFSGWPEYIPLINTACSALEYEFFLANYTGLDMTV